MPDPESPQAAPPRESDFVSSALSVPRNRAPAAHGAHGAQQVRTLGEPGSFQNNLQEGRDSAPKLVQRLNLAVASGVKGALIPQRRAIALLRVFADGVEKHLAAPYRQRMAVLRHEDHVAAALGADFLHPFGKARCLCQVQVGVGLAAMAIAAGDDDLPPALRQIDGAAVFLPPAQAVQLERVQKLVVGREEIFEALIEFRRRNPVQVPQRVIEDEQHVRLRVERA